MKALQVAKVKPRYVLVDGEWVIKTKPVEIVEEDWPTCGAPKVGLPCPKCTGSTRVVFHDGRSQFCYWCSDGKGEITMKDKRNFDRRVMKGLTLCFLKTVA
jgi:hypothetical protein